MIHILSIIIPMFLHFWFALKNQHGLLNAGSPLYAYTRIEVHLVLHAKSLPNFNEVGHQTNPNPPKSIPKST